MQHNIIIREYTERDARDLADIFYNTIHKININDYTQEQVNAWAPKSSLELGGWIKKWSNLKPMVAVIDSTIVGFTEFNDNGYIDCFYCHHEWIGHGVGRVMLHAIEDKANKLKIHRVFANVSITARPFFESKGFKLVKEQIVDCRGVELKNYVMEKILN